MPNRNQNRDTFKIASIGGNRGSGRAERTVRRRDSPIKIGQRPQFRNRLKGERHAVGRLSLHHKPKVHDGIPFGNRAVGRCQGQSLCGNAHDPGYETEKFGFLDHCEKLPCENLPCEACERKWWWGKDSNLGRRKPADLQSALVDRLSIPPVASCHPPGDARRIPNGARGGTRTRKDLSTCTSSMRVCQFHHPSRRENGQYDTKTAGVRQVGF